MVSRMKHETPFPVMADMTVKMMRRYLERSRSIILPVGMIEQHGYHLPLSTDALIATELGRLIGQRTDMLVAPTIQLSFSGGGLPGTINISPAVTSLVINDTLLSLCTQGFRNFYLFLCHGGSENVRAVQDGLRVMLRSNSGFADVLLALLPVWKFDRQKIGWTRAIDDHDWHAGWLETALVMALAPDKVRMDEMELDPDPVLASQIEHPDNYQRAEKIVDDPMVVPRMTQRPDISVGVMGHPERASPEQGHVLVDAIVEEVSAKIREIDAKADGVYREVPFTPEPIVL